MCLEISGPADCSVVATNKELQRKHAEFVILEKMDFSLSDSEPLIMFLHLLNPSFTLPTRQYIRDILLPEAFKFVKEQVEAAIRSQISVVLVCDGSTDQCNEQFSHIGVLLSNFKMILLKTVNHTNEYRGAVEQMTHLAEATTEINQYQVFVKGFISDYERKMLSCRDKLIEKVSYNLKSNTNFITQVQREIPENERILQEFVVSAK